MARKRQYGTGSIRSKKGRLYIRYRDANGVQQEEAAGVDPGGAKKLLSQRVGEVAGGVAPNKAGADITVLDCLNLLLADMKRRELASSRIAGWKIKSVLGDTIGWQKAAKFSWESAWKFIEARKKDGVQASTINRELSLIRSALRLAADPPNRLIPAAPKIPTLPEGDNVRTGFLTAAEYGRMRDALPEELKPLLCAAYYTGLRRSTLLSIRLDQVDIDAGLIWISRVQTKNRKSQTSPIIGEMRNWCLKALAAHKVYLFERGGKPIKSFKDSWDVARVEAGLPKLNFHDLRRTAVRDWIAAGADESTAMAISGHKTTAMLQRYNILDAANMQRAAKLRNTEPEIVPEKLREKRGNLVS